LQNSIKGLFCILAFSKVGNFVKEYRQEQEMCAATEYVKLYFGVGP